MRFKSITRGDLEFAADRFWRNIEVSDDCWNWKLANKGNGYGQFRISRSLGSISAHRAAWILANGDIPPGMYVCHTCDNRKCCNPDHMWLGTAKQNQRDMAAKGRVYSYAALFPEQVVRDCCGKFCKRGES